MAYFCGEILLRSEGVEDDSAKKWPSRLKIIHPEKIPHFFFYTVQFSFFFVRISASHFSYIVVVTVRKIPKITFAFQQTGLFWVQGSRPFFFSTPAGKVIRKNKFESPLQKLGKKQLVMKKKKGIPLKQKAKKTAFQKKKR